MILISGKEGEWTAEDVGLAAENLMLAAHAVGLGTCWIGFAQPWLKTPEGKRAVELDPNYIPIAPIIVGLSARDAAACPAQSSTASVDRLADFRSPTCGL